MKEKHTSHCYSTLLITYDSTEANIVLSPTRETVTEGDREIKTLCLSLNNSAIDATVGFSNDILIQLAGYQGQREDVAKSQFV